MKGKKAIMLLLTGLASVTEATKISFSEEAPMPATISNTNEVLAAQQELGRLRAEDLGFEFSSDLMNKKQQKLLLNKITLIPVNDNELDIIHYDQNTYSCWKQKQRIMLLRKRCQPFTQEEQNSLSLDSILLRTIVHSPLIRSKVNTTESKRWLVRKAFSTWYPSLSLSSGSLLSTNVKNTQNYGTPPDSTNPSVSGTAFQPTDPISNSSTQSNNSNGLVTPYTTTSSYTQAYPVLTLNWQFFDATRADNINAAKFGLDSATQDTKYAIHQVITEASALYTAIITAELKIAGFLDQLIAYDRFIKVIKNQVQKGYTPINELYNSQSQKQGILYELSNSESEYLQSIEALKALLNISPNQSLIIGNEMFMPSYWPYSEQETEDMIYKYPEVQSYFKQSSQYQSLAKSEYKSYIPKISLLGYTTYVGTKGSMSYSPPKQPNGAWSEQWSNYIGINATWNIFDGFSEYQTGKSYMSQSDSYREQGENTIVQLRESIYGALATFKMSGRLLNPLIKSYQLAIQSLSSQIKRSNIGLDDPTDVYQAEMQAATIINSFSEAYSSVLNSYFTLLDLSGAYIYIE
ncbi:TolC family protein [Prochlorococcus marinus]|uniref:TolC family protein n=1 Tax=Prochlorococcus TaxID=1218 RepID=UPI0007B3C00A|nr:TolC family protein [Prochlorococcus marinus]KZR77522.1 Outer membrane efflux protein [Prochlorococcus marinus str. MIT 1323]